MSEVTRIKEEGGIVLEMVRRFKAPREKVFDAWASLEAMSGWFGPATCEVIGGEVDFREGGRYRIEVKTEEYGEVAVGGEYREITRPERIIFSWQWQGHDELCPVEMEVTIEFWEDEDDATELRLRQTGFPEREVAEHHGKGWGGSFEKLGTHLMNPERPR